MARAKPEQKTSATDWRRIAIDRHILDDLLADGTIDQAIWQSSLDWLHPSHQWARWAMRLFLAFGTALVLAGIVFFFAFNWLILPDLTKLGLIQGALILSAIGAWYLGIEQVIGQLLLISASVLVGVFMAVFGQVYQSGADAWTLFALWAVLITPWTLLSRSPFHWLLWLALANLALSLWWDQAIGRIPNKSELQMLMHVALNTGLLAIREVCLTRASDHWLSPIWTRWILLACLLIASFPVLYEGYTEFARDPVSLGGAVVCSAVIGSLFFLFRKKQLDIPALAMILLLSALLSVMLFVELMEALDISNIGITFLTALFVISVFALAASYLRGLLSLEKEEEGMTHV